MSSRPLLEGGADEVVRLRREIVGLEQELTQARAEALTAKQASLDAIQAIRALRQQLDPFYKALKMVFGEISRIDAETVNQTANPGTDESLWQQRIGKAGTQHARILQTLLDGGGTMSFAQIRISARTGGNTSALLSQLIAKNWIHKVGHGSYALK